MSCSLWVHAGDGVKEGGFPFNVGKACATSDISVLDVMEPMHTEDTFLTVHVQCLQVV